MPTAGSAWLDSGSSHLHLAIGDADLLVLKSFQGISIVTPREFLELVSGARFR